MRPLFFAFLLTFSPAALSAQTLTTRDIVSLTKAGLGEEVLVALIEVHRSVFPVDGDTLKMLKDAGVPQNVIVAMVRSGRDIPQPDRTCRNRRSRSSSPGRLPTPPAGSRHRASE